MKFSAVVYILTIISCVSAQTLRIFDDANNKAVGQLLNRQLHYDTDSDSDSDSDSDDEGKPKGTGTKKSTTSKKCSKTTTSKTTTLKKTTSKKCTKTTAAPTTTSCPKSITCTTGKKTILWIFVFKTMRCSVYKVCPTGTTIVSTIVTTASGSDATFPDMTTETFPEETTETFPEDTTETFPEDTTETFPEQTTEPEAESTTFDSSEAQFSSEVESSSEESSSEESYVPLTTWILFHAGPGQSQPMKRDLKDGINDSKNASTMTTSKLGSNGSKQLTSAEGLGQPMIPSIGAIASVLAGLILLL
ncbi:hypothetical protein Cantr_01468 [Candida viswanathii]|uniref:Uncharacterized protein n=1 Tax=Candida viswanathii TaxID=5486 RepID=A0A367YJ07_9ASCO|nr:hypothetical protein Cantr_01468 [Candida viswanathii]